MPDVTWLIRAQDKLEESVAAMYCQSKHGHMQDGRGEADITSSGAACKECGFVQLAAVLEEKLKATFIEAHAIVIVDCLPGYTAANGKFVLRVEVTEPVRNEAATGAAGAVGASAPGSAFRSRAYIVKIAYPNGRKKKDPRDQLGAELRGWEACKRRGNARGRIFMNLKPGLPSAEKHGGYETLKYEDAHQVLRAAEVLNLEQAVLDACQWGRPSAESVDDAIAQIYFEMSDRFYKRSWSQQAGSMEGLNYWRTRVADGVGRWLDRKTPPGQCRDEALCLLSSAEKDFADPCNYMEEVWSALDNIPELQRGCSHGDLHGRNIMVGLIDGQAKWSAVYDYEDMGCGNYLGWDFVKLEIELKVRALCRVLAGGQRGFVRGVYAFETALDQETEKRNNAGVWEHESSSSDAWKGCLESIRQVAFGTDAPPRGGPAAAEGTAILPAPTMTTDRGDAWLEINERGLRALWIILLGIRRMARMCLETHRGRNRRWLDEYYFLLMCYGGYVGRFPSYQHREWLGAYVSTGVAAYRFAWRRELRGKLVRLAVDEAKKSLAEDTKPRDHFPDLDVPCPFAETAFAREYARSRRRPFIEKAVEIFRALHARHPQLVDVAHELVFAILEESKVAEHENNQDKAKQLKAEVERLTREFEIRYRGVEPEMLSRVGRIWKEGGDAHLQTSAAGIPQEAVDFYREALKYYGKAYERTKEPERKYYPGINAATCLWLSGDDERSRQVAREVLELLEKLPHAEGEENVWRLASRAEAKLLLGQKEEARMLYGKATQDPDCSVQGRATMKDQVNRILRKPPSEGLKPGDLYDIFKVPA